MNAWKRYRRNGMTEVRAYVSGENLSLVSVSAEDLKRDTLQGGMIARNPDNPADQWYINPDYFAKHYEEML